MRVKDKIFMQVEFKVLLLSIIIFLLTIPFGYWRANTKTKSLEWFATIHIPVLIIIFIRFQLGVDFSLSSLVINILSFIFGQAAGMKLFVLMRKLGINGTSCLIIDLKQFFFDKK